MTQEDPGFFELRPVELDFLDSAPMRVDIDVATSLPQDAVWSAFVDPTTWDRWFPGVVEADYPGQAPPFGVGSVRVANVEGQLFEETILAWDEPERWTYRIDRCTAELARAQVESTELAPLPGGGTCVRWILASDPCEGLLAARDVLPQILEQRLSEALRNLEGLHARS